MAIQPLPPVPNAPIVVTSAELDALWKRWFSELRNQWSPGGTLDHNDLSGLQGGTTDEYYHLTSAQSTALANVGALGNNRVLYSDGSGVVKSEAAFGYEDTTNTLTADNVTATTFTGALVGNATSATLASTVTVADAASDTTTFLVLAGSATGSLPMLTDAGLTYNASTDSLTVGGTGNGALLTIGGSEHGDVIATPNAQVPDTIGAGSNDARLEVRAVTTEGQFPGLTIVSWDASPVNTINRTTNLVFAKSLSGTIDTFGVSALAAGNIVGNILAAADDSVNFEPITRLDFAMDETAASNSVGGRFVVNVTGVGTNTLREVLRADSSQRVVFSGGTDTRVGALTLGTAGQLQVQSDQTNTGIAIAKFSADAVSGNLDFAKSRSGTLGTNTIVAASDVLAQITGYGANGTTYDPAAQIRMISDGTPGASADMPGAIIMATTANASATLTDRLKLTNAGNFVFLQDNANDIGATAATRPRTGYFGTSVITPLLDSGAASAISFDTNTGTKQVEISHTASASRYITLTGSNGGNPTIGVSAGNLAITPITAHANKIYPGTDGAAAQTASGLYAGTGAPNNANGSDGDYYFRGDGGVATHIYFKAAGAWAGII